MSSAPLLHFKSHIGGKNADVTIWADRIEWHLVGSLARAGSPLRRTKGTEMMPVRAVSSVNSVKDGLRFTKVVVIAAGNTVEFRVGHGEAGQIRDLLTQLVVGSHPTQQVVAPPAPAPPPPPVAGPPAGWVADPHGRHELRYWDGAAWTSHVSDGGVQSTDGL